MKENLNWGLFSKYRPELYGVATIMIMIFHCNKVIELPGLINTINSHLNYGVDVFLFLSGISLYFSYSKDSSYKSFMKKRFTRTMLPYLIIGGIYWCWKYLFAEFSILDFLYYISGASLFLSKENGFISLTASSMKYVGFILVMYAIYPIIFNALFNVPEKKKNRNFAVMLILSVAVTLFIRFYAENTYAEQEIALTRVPIFLLGCYFGKAVKEKQKFKLSDYILFTVCIPLKIIIAFIIKPIYWDYIFHRYLGIFAAMLVCFAVVFVLEIAYKVDILKKIANKTLSFFGNLSLEIYLTHILFLRVLTYYIPDISASDAFSFRQKVLIYGLLLLISVIISFAFNKAFNYVLKKFKAKKTINLIFR